LKFKDFNRDTELAQTFLAVDQMKKYEMNHEFKTAFSGFVGLAPWSKDDPYGEYDFLHQL